MELNAEQMTILHIQCPRCSSTFTVPYAGRHFCIICGNTWRRNGEPDVRENVR